MAPRQMFTHSLDVLKGWVPGNMGALDHSAVLSANVIITAYYGRVVHLNSDKEYEMGAISWQMPIFLMQNSDDPDTGNVDGDDIWTGGIPATSSGSVVMSGIVASGGYEVETTEYDTAQTYVPNEPLRAVASNSSQSTGGTLTNQSIGAVGNPTANVCGVVSTGVRAREGNQGSVLALWTVYCPRQ